jgi:hypothetical protein
MLPQKDDFPYIYIYVNIQAIFYLNFIKMLPKLIKFGVYLSLV